MSTSTTRLSLSRIAVSISWLFIMKPPSPQIAITFCSGCSSAAIMAEGKPAPMVASALSSNTVLGW